MHTAGCYMHVRPTDRSSSIVFTDYTFDTLLPQQVLNAIDTDGDGVVDFNEFVRYFQAYDAHPLHQRDHAHVSLRSIGEEAAKRRRHDSARVARVRGVKKWC